MGKMTGQQLLRNGQSVRRIVEAATNAAVRSMTDMDRIMAAGRPANVAADLMMRRITSAVSDAVDKEKQR